MEPNGTLRPSLRPPAIIKAFLLRVVAVRVSLLARHQTGVQFLYFYAGKKKLEMFDNRTADRTSSMHGCLNPLSTRI